MQVLPAPPVPIVPGAAPQEALTKALPQVQAQAAAPISQRAIEPSSKSDRGHRSRSNNERAKGRGSSPDGRGGSVNIKV